MSRVVFIFICYRFLYSISTDLCRRDALAAINARSKSDRPGGGPPTGEGLLEGRPRPEQCPLEVRSARGRASYRTMPRPLDGRPRPAKIDARGMFFTLSLGHGYNQQLIGWLGECFHELSRHHQHRAGQTQR